MRGRSHLLSCLSQVTVHDFAEASDAFLVMASDGVWEFIDSQGAVEIVNAFIEQSATEVRRAGAAEPMATLQCAPHRPPRWPRPRVAPGGLGRPRLQPSRLGRVRLRFRLHSISSQACTRLIETAAAKWCQAG